MSEPGLSCCMMRERGLVSPSTPSDGLAALRWLQTREWAQPRPIKELPSWAQPNCWFLPKVWEVGALYMLISLQGQNWHFPLIRIFSPESLPPWNLRCLTASTFFDRLWSKCFALCYYVGTHGWVKSVEEEDAWPRCSLSQQRSIPYPWSYGQPLKKISSPASLWSSPEPLNWS